MKTNVPISLDQQSLGDGSREWRGQRGLVCKGPEGNLQMTRHVRELGCDDGLVDVLMTKFTKLHIFNMCHLMSIIPQ